MQLLKPGSGAGHFLFECHDDGKVRELKCGTGEVAVGESIAAGAGVISKFSVRSLQVSPTLSDLSAPRSRTNRAGFTTSGQQRTANRARLYVSLFTAADGLLKQ